MHVLAEVAETREAYMIGKIWWVVTQYRDEQQLPGWKRMCQRRRYLQTWNVQLTQLWKCCVGRFLARRRSRC